MGRMEVARMGLEAFPTNGKQPALTLTSTGAGRAVS